MLLSRDRLRFDGVVWRYVPARAHPLHAGFLLRAAGRWNRYGEYGCLYTALTREGAVAEFRKVHRNYVGLAAGDAERKDLVSLLVRVEPVLDLSDRAVRRRYGVTRAALTADTEDSLETCRSLADFARAQAYRAILSPSAAMRRAVNLTIYLEGRAANLRLREGPNREAMNY